MCRNGTFCIKKGKVIVIDLINLRIVVLKTFGFFKHFLKSNKLNLRLHIPAAGREEEELALRHAHSKYVGSRCCRVEVVLESAAAAPQGHECEGDGNLKVLYLQCNGALCECSCMNVGMSSIIQLCIVDRIKMDQYSRLSLCQHDKKQMQVFNQTLQQCAAFVRKCTKSPEDGTLTVLRARIYTLTC